MAKNASVAPTVEAVPATAAVAAVAVKRKIDKIYPENDSLFPESRFYACMVTDFLL